MTVAAFCAYAGAPSGGAGCTEKRNRIRLTDSLQSVNDERAVTAHHSPIGQLASENNVNNTKYLVGLAGLVVGILVSFLWVSSYNKSHAPAAAQSPTGSMPAATGSGGQQAMMGDVQQTIEKAKNNPKDFQAQLDAAEKFNSIQRLPETVEYLARAYEA